MPRCSFLRRPALLRTTAALAMLASIVLGGQAAFSSSSDGYVVQPGDSLWAISQRAGISMQALAAANGMQLSDILAIGRHLVVPGAGASSEGSSSSEGDSASTGGNDSSGVTAAPASVVSSGGTTGSSFCSTFSEATGPWGVLPALLQESPGRLGLRPYFQEWGWAYGVRPALLEAIAWQESGWQQGVVSSAQAVGVGQLLPSTAAFVAQDLLGAPLDIYSTSDNIRLMARFVAYLQSQVQGTCNVIASYYEGTQNLRSYGVFQETEPYVANVEYLLPQFS